MKKVEISIRFRNRSGPVNDLVNDSVNDLVFEKTLHSVGDSVWSLVAASVRSSTLTPSKLSVSNCIMSFEDEK